MTGDEKSTGRPWRPATGERGKDARPYVMRKVGSFGGVPVGVKELPQPRPWPDATSATQTQARNTSPQPAWTDQLDDMIPR